MAFTLTGRYPLGTLEGRDGVLRFEPSTTIVGDGNIVLPAPVTVRLDAGAFTVDLVGTDDVAYVPSGWVWTVTETLTGGRAPWSFELTADSDLADLATVATPTDPNLYTPITRTLTAGDGLTGGGTLAANRTFAVGAGTGISVAADAVSVVYGSTAGTAAEGSALTAEAGARVAGDAAAQAAAEATAAGALASHEADTTGVHGIADTAALVLTGDARLSDDRDPTAHASTHAAAGADPVTVAESQVTGLTAALAAKIPAATLDANSLLYAVTDNTPAALAVGASTIVGRAASGDIAALSVADVRTLVGTTRVTRPNTDDRLVEVWNGAAWSVVNYHSGKRDISALLTTGWTGTAYMQRVNYEVTIWLGVTAVNATPSTTVLTVPTGWRPDVSGTGTRNTQYLATRGSSGATVRFIHVNNPDTLRIIDQPAAAEGAFRFGVPFTCEPAIPTSLPGTLISAAPA